VDNLIVDHLGAFGPEAHLVVDAFAENPDDTRQRGRHPTISLFVPAASQVLRCSGEEP
jgi:hypothetical protein